MAFSKRKAGGLAGKIGSKFGGSSVTKEILLQKKVFGRALDAASFDMCAAGWTKPMGGRDGP